MDNSTATLATADHALGNEERLLPPDDAQRVLLHNEVHARPPARIRLPALVLLLAVSNEGVSRQQEWEHLRRLPGQEGLTLEQLQGNFLRLRLPGYVVPLDTVSGTVREFLLVPYYGACVHSPPPPANQIVHVTLPARRPLRSMDAVWVSGEIRAKRQPSAAGVSGYVMDASLVQPYRRPER